MKLVLIVASGKTPTTSPSFSARTAASKAAAPALRSTGMCRMARMNGPANQWSNTADLAMNRTSRCCGSAPSPRKVKSKKLTWLLQMIAPPSAGTCSEPADVEAEAEQPEDDQRQPDDEAVGPVPRVRARAEQVAADDVAPARRVHGRNLTVGRWAPPAASPSPAVIGHRGAGDGGQVAASPGGRGAAGRRRCPGAGSPPRPSVDPLLVAGVGQRGADVVEQVGDDVAGRRRPAGARVDQLAGDPRAAGPPGREPRGPRCAAARPGAVLRAAVSTRARTRPACVTASSTRRQTSATRTSTVGQLAESRASK